MKSSIFFSTAVQKNTCIASVSISLRFHNPHLPCQESTNRVPHLSQDGITYFATFRLSDSVPQGMLREFTQQKQEWLAKQPDKPWPMETEKEYHQKFSQRFERWLDQGYGECLLKDTGNARIVADGLKHFEGERSLLHAWVIMPNHVHILFSTLGEHTLSALMQSWKGFSAKQINARLHKTGPVWQKSYYDRMIRDWDHFSNCARYIRQNPTRARLKQSDWMHGESDLVRRMIGSEKVKR
jgi:REP element-mobilizing transposase RayT